MQIGEMAEALGWKLLTENTDTTREVKGCYCGDLLSWVMGRAKADDAWLTVMGNVNAIAVASLADTAGIVLVEDAVLDADAKRVPSSRKSPCTAHPCLPLKLRSKSLHYWGECMNSYRYDLHLHSCLSPCGDTDMTPNNLVNMAALLGCDIIALTDHNTCRNTPAAVKVGQATDVLVIPGMELCTAEEAHVVCLFETVEDALAFDKYVCAHIPKVPNRPEIFGEQWILNENDEKIGEISELLITATDISINDVQALVKKFNGVAFPAHVDKDAYSVTASLALPAGSAVFRSRAVPYCRCSTAAASAPGARKHDTSAQL